MRVARWYGNTTHQSSIAEMEKKSHHPIAMAISKFATRTGYKKETPTKLEIHEHIGMGISGTSHQLEILVGNEKLLDDFFVKTTIGQIRLANQIAANGYTPVWVAVNGEVSAIIALEDDIREDAAESVKQLRLQGWNIGILSGDHQKIVDRVGKRLDIESQNCVGEASPEDKLKIVSESSAKDNVVMVGDGVNDCAALAAATVGLAVKNGAEASLLAAPVYLATPGLSPILDLLKLSQSTRRTMRTNFAVSLTYNIALATAAFLGLVNPLVAAIIMPISSLTVVSLSLSAGKTNVGGNRK